MEAAAPNPLLSNQKSSDLQVILHPLVLLTISDYITRHTLRQQQGPIVGALLGQQNGREITVEHAFECHMKVVSDMTGEYSLDHDKFGARLEQMVTVHKDRNLDFVGWYTLMPPSGPSEAILPVHNQFLQGNESAVLLGFHPEEVLSHSVGSQLPLTIYESNWEVEKVDQDGEDKTMEDGDGSLKIKFRELPYTVETDETEMISMNYIASGGGSAAAITTKEEKPSRSIESNGKGKRRLVESADEKKKATQDDETALNVEEEELIAALTAKSNAIKMLHSRIHLFTTYLERLPPSYVRGEQADSDSMDTGYSTPSLTVLRNIQALVGRLGLIIPSDEAAFEKEMLCEANNVDVTRLLSSIVQGSKQARELAKTFSVIETTKASRRRAQEYAGPGPHLHATGDLMV